MWLERIRFIATNLVNRAITFLGAITTVSWRDWYFVILGVETHLRFVRNVPLFVNLYVVVRLGRSNLVALWEMRVGGGRGSRLCRQFNLRIRCLNDFVHSVLTSVEIRPGSLLLLCGSFLTIAIWIIIQQYSIRLVKLTQCWLVGPLAHGGTTLPTAPFLSLFLTNI